MLLLNVLYNYRKGGVYYLQWYVPEDVRQHYKTNRVSFSLRTKSARNAMALARSASAKLEAYWHSLRFCYGEVLAQHLVSFRGQGQREQAKVEQPLGNYSCLSINQFRDVIPTLSKMGFLLTLKVQALLYQNG